MLKKVRRLLFFGLSLVMALALLPTVSSGADALMLKLGLEELTEGADAIVLGSVVGTVSRWNADGTAIYTEVVISVEESLKDPPAGSTITVIVPGGTVGQIAQCLSDTPRFADGEKAILFLKQVTPERLCEKGLETGGLSLPLFELHGPYRGKLEIAQDKIGDPPVAGIKEQVERILMEGGSGSSTLLTESSAITFDESGYVYNGQRWFGDWPVVDYRVKAPDGDSNTAVQNAASSWSNAGARFSFDYAGTHSRTGGYEFNGVNEVVWYDLGTNGALARAVWWYNPSTGEIVEADMEFNTRYIWSTATPTPSGSFDVETVALHEFGHWLSLGHSDIEEAIMWPYYKGTQRALHDDDVAGIQHIYGAVPTYTISGTILDGEGLPVQGVSVTATGGHEQTVTPDEHGVYTLAGVEEGAEDIVITPTLAGYGFEPVSCTVEGPVQADVENQDFAATPTVTCETSGTFTSERYKPGTWSYDISIIRDGGGAFVGGTIELTAPDASVIEAEVVEVKCDYAHWFDKTPNFAAVGTAVYGSYTGNFMFLIADSHIQMVLSTSDYSAPWATETVWSSGNRDYDIVSADGGFWVDCLCSPPPPACATIDPTAASYNLLGSADVATTITWNGASSVVSVHDGTGYLTGGDYTVVGDTLTILDAYLSAKLTASGQSVALTIEFDYCNPATFTITAVEGILCETSGTFTSSRHKPGTWSYDISIIRDGAGQFVSGTIVLTAPDAIVVTGTVLDVKCDYAHWASRTPNFAAAGTATYGTWTGYFIFLLADSHIQMLLSTSDYSAPWAAETLWSSGQRAYDIVAADGGFWVDCLCPVPPACATISPTGASYNLLDPDDATTTITWNDATAIVSVHDGAAYLAAGTDYTVVGNTLTILDAYLSGKLTASGQSAVLTIDFDVCDDATFTITAVEGVPCEVSGTFTSSRHKPGTWSYDISIIRDGAGQFVSGTIVLTAPDAIVVTGTVLDVKCDYAHWASRTPNFAAAGTATYGTWTGYFIFLLADSHIQMLLSTSDYSAPWAAETLWSSGQRAYDIVGADGGFWVSCLCP